MFIEITGDVVGYKTGDVLEVADGIGRAYIDDGKARESNGAAHLNRAMETGLAKIKEDILVKTKEIIAEARGTTTVPIKGGSSVEIAGAPGTSRTGMDREIPGPLTLILATQVGNHVAQRNAHALLKNHYKLQPTQWRDASDLDIPEMDGIERAGSESTGSAQTYGYLVRPEFVPSIFEIPAEDSVMTGVRSVPAGSTVDVEWPALDQYGTPGAKTSAAFAGVTLYRKTEDQQRTASDAKVSMIQFKITDLTGLTYLSRDLFADAFISMDAFISGLFAGAFNWRKDYDYLWGTGVGEPLGILNNANPALVVQPRNTQNKILYEDLAAMISKLHPRARAGAFWLTTLTALPSLQAVKDAGGAYVYQPNAVITQSQQPSIYAGMLMGFPVKVSEKVPVLGSQSDISLVCPPHYGEAMRQGIEVGFSDQFKFDTDQLAFRWKMRHDGRPLWKGTYKLADGSNTQVSPFVTLKATTS